MLQMRTIPVTPFQQNCSLVWCDQTNQAALVDPGGDVERIQAAVVETGVEVVAIWLTHGHLDHVGGALQLSTALDVKITGPHRDDLFWLQGLPQFAQQMGFPPAQPFTPHQWLQQGDRLSLGELRFQVLHCPGHTPGHVALFEPQSKTAFVGDLLFAGSVGRTDFPKGNFEDLMDSIRGRLWPLGDDVRFVPGHGPMSTFGQERATNPYVADHNFSGK